MGRKPQLCCLLRSKGGGVGLGGHHILPPHPCTGFPGGLDGKRIYLQCRRSRFSPWVKKIPWRREWLPTPVFLPKEFHGQRSLAGYSPQGGKESDRTEQLTHTHTLALENMEPKDQRDFGLKSRNGEIACPGLRRSPEEGNGYPLQYSCLENSMDRGAWQAIVHSVAKSWT